MIDQNAVEAYEPGAARIAIHVTARSERRGAEIVLAIRDEGCGMTDAQRENLFVPFGSRKAGGTGVGMIVVRKMVESVHGGTLTIQSAEGQGTMVTMRLAARQP